MLNFLRKIPTPCYGNYGGGYRSRKDKKPIDKMDEAFREHDLALEEIQRQINILKSYRKTIDGLLAMRLKETKPKSLYARLYRKCCLLIFKEEKGVKK